MNTVRTIVVDDEPLARARLVDLLADEDRVEVIAECKDAQEAVAAIQRLLPDLAFLDVQMPGADAFRVLETLDPQTLPLVIFVTAFERHAVRAFDVRAVDYLLKPFDRDRFREALSKAKQQMEMKERGELAARVIEMADQARSEASDRVIVKSKGRLIVWHLDQIDFVEAVGNYVRIYVGRESHLLRETMTSLEGRLDARRFMRIHRSRIVNLDRIRELEPTESGDYIVTLTTGVQLTLSRKYKAKLHDRFGSL